MNIFGMDIKIIFALLAAIAAIAAYVPYLKEIREGKTKPHVYTWLIWTLTNGTATAGLWYGGGGYGAASQTVSAVLTFFFFLLCFRYGTKNITLSDSVVLFFALAAIAVWWFLENAFVAVLMATAIDALGYIPSMRKSLEEPWSESLSAWVIFSAASFFGLLALASYNFLTVVYLAMSLTANIILLTICVIRRKNVPMPEGYAELKHHMH